MLHSRIRFSFISQRYSFSELQLVYFWDWDCNSENVWKVHDSILFNHSLIISEIKILLSSSVKQVTHFFLEYHINWSAHNFETFRDQRTITAVAWYITLNADTTCATKTKLTLSVFSSKRCQNWRMYNHDLEVMDSNPGRVEIWVRHTSG